MEFRKSDVLPGYKNSVYISPDEMPQNPPTPLSQKMISFDVSDISQISDASEANNELSSLNYKLLNNKNLYQSTSKFSQLQSTPLNAVTWPDRTIAEQIAAPVLPQHVTGPMIGQSHCTTATEVDKNSKLEVVADLNVPFLWECLKRQAENFNTLQEQFSRILEQKAVPCQPDPASALVPKRDISNPVDLEVSQQNTLKEAPISSSRNSYGGESRDNCLLSCLQAQNEQIQKLQEQNQKLLELNMTLLKEKQELQDWNQELKFKLLLKNQRKSLNKLAEEACPSFPSEHPFVDNQTRSVSTEERNKQNFTNGAFQQQQTEAKQVYNSTKTKPNDIGGVEFREEKEIEKTSTSTMTSLIYDGSDKVVYQKLTTVTTDFKKQCNEISAQRTMSKEPMDTPQNRSSPKDATSSSRRKKGKCRKCGKCSPHHTSVKAISPRVNSLDAPGNGCRKMQQTSPESGGETGRNVLQNYEEEIEVQNIDPERIIFPRYENILRNVNELNLNCNEVETTPRVKPFLKPSCKERKKYTPSPRAVDLSPENRRHSNRRKSSSTASNTSTESVGSSPNCSIQDIPFKNPESDTMLPGGTTLSVYGLSSPNLSNDTKRYLENFGLVRDRSDDSLKYGKSRTTLVKRYLR